MSGRVRLIRIALAAFTYVEGLSAPCPWPPRGGDWGKHDIRAWEAPMEKAFDLVVRGGTVVDGSGQPAFEADVAVKDGVIAAIGQVNGTGAEEIDARGQLVTPGFVDVHCHYDGQATWDDRMQPSSWHGV